MNVARQRVLNVLTGVVFALLGCAAYGAAAYLVLVPPKPILGVESLEVDTKPCMQMLTRLGFQVTKQKVELRAEKRGGLENAERLLADASIGIAACGLPLTRFCMGTGCQAPAIPDGISFALSTQVAPPELE